MIRQDFEAAREFVRAERAHYLTEFREEGFRRAAKRMEDREKKDQETRFDTADLAAVMVVSEAYQSRIDVFGERIDTHQQAVVEALLENQEQLDRIVEERDEMLEAAYELADGTKVFKTEDGLRVFDADGNELSSEIIDPDLIDDRHPTWESFSQILEAQRALELERVELIDYQDRLDQAQELIDRGNLSEDDFSTLDDLLGDAPDAVRSRLPQDDPSYLAPDQNAELGVDFSGLEIASPGLPQRKF